MFAHCVVLGSGSLAGKCSAFLINKGIRLILSDSAGEHSLHPLRKENNESVEHMNPVDLFKWLENVEERTLVLSINNMRILPEKVFGGDNVVFVNYHNSLLPAYRGRNAEAWVIFNREKYTGITWHHMTPQVDSGDIIHQVPLELKDDDTALNLLQRQSATAFDGFPLLFDRLWTGNTAGRTQGDRNARSYRALEKPNGGMLDTTWDAPEISAFLRAMDYGPLHILGKPFVFLEDRPYTWSHYRIENTGGGAHRGKMESGRHVIQRNGWSFTLSGLEELR